MIDKICVFNIRHLEFLSFNSEYSATSHAYRCRVQYDSGEMTMLMLMMMFMR